MKDHGSCIRSAPNSWRKQVQLQLEASFRNMILVGGFNPWKIWKSDWIIIPTIRENKIHVPNHQPGYCESCVNDPQTRRAAVCRYNRTMAAMAQHVHIDGFRLVVDLTNGKLHLAFGWHSTELVPSGKLTVCYWTWPFIVSFPIKNGDFP